MEVCQHYFNLNADTPADGLKLGCVSTYFFYNFMWEKFGINPNDVGKCNLDWINLMLTVSGAQSKVEIQRMKQK